MNEDLLKRIDILEECVNINDKKVNSLRAWKQLHIDADDERFEDIELDIKSIKDSDIQQHVQDLEGEVSTLMEKVEALEANNTIKVHDMSVFDEPEKSINTIIHDIRNEHEIGDPDAQGNYGNKRDIVALDIPCFTCKMHTPQCNLFGFDFYRKVIMSNETCDAHEQMSEGDAEHVSRKEVTKKLKTFEIFMLGRCQDSEESSTTSLVRINEYFDEWFKDWLAPREADDAE